MMINCQNNIDGISDEDELQEYLKRKFECHGWNVRREVTPDNAPLRADLLLNHEKFGRLGIETKYVGKRGGDAIIAQGHGQITQQYWEKKYDGKKVLLWALCPYIEGEYRDDPGQYTRTRIEARHQAAGSFCNEYGIGYLRLTTHYTSVDYAASVPERQIPAFPVDSEIPLDRYKKVNIEAIQRAVAENRNSKN